MAIKPVKYGRNCYKSAINMWKSFYLQENTGVDNQSFTLYREHES